MPRVVRYKDTYYKCVVVSTRGILAVCLLTTNDRRSTKYNTIRLERLTKNTYLDFALKRFKRRKEENVSATFHLT